MFFTLIRAQCHAEVSPNRTRAAKRPGTLEVMDTLSYTPDAQNLPADPTGRRGLFIVVEGGDGAGKTTQLALLNKALRDRGYRVITTREPGGTRDWREAARPRPGSRSGTIDDRTEALILRRPARLTPPS